MIKNIIDAHKQYFTNPFYIRNTARFYALATGLFGRTIANQPAFFLGPTSKDRMDQKIAKLVAYASSCYLYYKNITSVHEDGIRYDTPKEVAITWQRLSNTICYIYDTALLSNFFIGKPLFSPLHEYIRGIAEVIAALSSYKFNRILDDEYPARNQKHVEKILRNITLIALAAEGLLLIAKSTIKNKAPMLQNYLLIAGITNTAFNYLHSIRSSYSKKTS